MFRRLTWDAAVFWGCLALAGIVIGLTDARASTSYEVSAGKCSYVPIGTGSWWHGAAYTYDNHLTTCAQIGIAKDSWRIAYVDLGQYKVNEYALGDGVTNDVHWYAKGYGETQGLSLGLFKDYRFGRFSVSGEGGAFLYDTYWKAEAVHIASNMTREVSTKHHNGLAPYLGLGIGYQLTERVSLTFNVRGYFQIKSDVHDRDPSSGDQIGWRSANVVSKLVGVVVSF